MITTNNIPVAFDIASMNRIIDSVNLQHYDTTKISNRKISSVEQYEPLVTNNKLE